MWSLFYACYHCIISIFLIIISIFGQYHQPYLILQVVQLIFILLHIDIIIRYLLNLISFYLSITLKQIMIAFLWLRLTQLLLEWLRNYIDVWLWLPKTILLLHRYIGIKLLSILTNTISIVLLVLNTDIISIFHLFLLLE